MKGDFHESMLSKNRDLLDLRNPDFDWDALYRRLNEDAHAQDNDRDLAGAVTGLLQMLVPYREGRIYARSLGLRLIALAWVLDPGYFPGNPSLAELARRANITAAKLSRYTGHYSRMLGWRNRGQRHAWNWRKGQRSRFRDEKSRNAVATPAQRPGSRRENASAGQPKVVAPPPNR